MRMRLTACIGIFSVMALSNAIVPVLPTYAADSFTQGGIFAAYFLGAFIMTLPAGMISDRYGRTPVLQAGLAVTIISGIILILATTPTVIIVARLVEGIGAGMVVAASMAYVNSLPDHETMSGYLMASLNFGLVCGLIVGGFLAHHTTAASAGIAVFTLFSVLPAILSISPVEPRDLRIKPEIRKVIQTLVTDYRWLWYSSIILFGVTGVVTSLYPEFSDVSPDQAGIWIASMSVATVLTVLVVSRLNLPPVPTIRAAALLMAGGVMISFFTPAGFILIGIFAGVVMIAQMAFLAQASNQQGVTMGLFSTTTYLGMSLLPFLAGFIATSTNFFLAYCATACAALTVSLTIGRCTCRLSPKPGNLRAT